MEKDTLKDDLEDFRLCMDAESDQRKQSLDDLEFAVLSKQWRQEDVDQRQSEGRPCLTINRLPAFAKQVTNDARMNRASIHIQPVGNGADREVADVQSDLIRGIEVRSQADQVYETAFNFAVNCGVGYFRINVDYACEDEWDQDIFLERIDNPFSVYGDYESKEATSIDWNRAYVTDWYSKAKFEAKFGKDRKATGIGIRDEGWDENWFSDKRIRVAERWFRDEVPAMLVKLSDGSVMLDSEFERQAEFLIAQGITVKDERPTKTYKVGQRIMNGVEILEENEWLGKYIPIVPMYGEEVNVAGKRHFISLIRRAKDPQRLYNYQRTLAAELGGLQPKAPWIGPKGAFDSDHARWATANRQAHPYLEWDPVPEAAGASPQRQPFLPPHPGVMQEALMASDDMKAVMGIFDASLGAKGNETSGKAIIARQREGDTSTFDFLDNRNRSVEHGGRIILDLIPRIYTAERILRCIQEDDEPYVIPVNQPAVQEHQLAAIMEGKPVPEKPEEGRPKYVPLPQQLPPMSPEQAKQLEAVTKVFDLTTGRYDVMVTAGPGFNTRREEAATQMMEFIRVFPQAAGLIGDLLAKNLDWPGADKVAERLKAMVPPQARGQVDPMVAQLQQMLQTQDAQAKQAVATLQKQIEELQRQVKDKQAETQVKAFEAETRRIEVLKPEQQQGPTGPDPLEVARVEIEREKLRIAAFEAETERIKVLNEAAAARLGLQNEAVTAMNQSSTPANDDYTDEPEMPHTPPDDDEPGGAAPAMNMPPMMGGMDMPMMGGGMPGMGMQAPPGAMPMMDDMQTPPDGGVSASGDTPEQHPGM